MAPAFPCLCCVPCACAMCALSMPLDDDVSVPPRKHTGGQVQYPQGVLAWVGGGGMALRTRGTPIYILIYILRFISLF